MTGKSSVRVTDKDVTVKEKLADWLFNQGVSTVLLFMLVAIFAYGIKYMVPVHLKQIQEGYEKIESAHEREMNRVIDVLIEKKQTDFRNASEKTVRFAPTE